VAPGRHARSIVLYAIGWWVWRRRHPGWAAASLATGIGMGTLLGLGRMAAGGHFLSDAVWSGLIAYGVAHLLYYHVMRIPAREDSLRDVYPLLDRSPRLRRTVVGTAIVLTAGIIGGGIVASPHDRDLTAQIRLADYPAIPLVLEVIADTLDVELHLVSPSEAIVASGYLHGFGLPTNELTAAWEFVRHPTPTVRLRIASRGWFPDIDGLLRLRVPVGTLRTIRIQLGRGDIGVIDAIAGGANPNLAPVLDLSTADGRVRKP
jgi:lipid A 4'-phosphatase